MESKEIAGLSQDDVLKYVLNVLFYEDKYPKELTHKALKLINEAKPMMGEANALFIEGILQFDLAKDSSKYFIEAEQKGCRHPVLYRYLADCYREGNKGVDQNHSKVLQYSEIALSGGCMSAYLEIFNMYRFGCEDIKRNPVQGFLYLLELEREGYVAASLYHTFGDSYKSGDGCGRSYVDALDYFQRAKDLEYPRAYLSMYDMYWYGGPNFPVDKTKATLLLLEAEKKGLKDERILNYLVGDVTFWNDTISGEVLGKFKNKIEMALYYCDILIQRGASSGYYYKGGIYWKGECIPRDRAKAISIWEEADRLGLAENLIYYSYRSDLSHAYMAGEDIPQNGAKVLEYCKKALELCSIGHLTGDIYSLMADVYEQGIPPIEQDLEKAAELRQLGELTQDY